MNQKDFNNLPKEKFVLVNEDKKLRDKELATKPIGFFKDAMYRFARNKGSIVGAIAIGVLVLYAIVAPIFSPYPVSYNDNYYSYMLPNLLDNENIDFLDGAKNVDTNFITFVEHYSKGLETNINAVKRQEYKYNADTEKYHYRLDSVRAVGTVFMKGVSRKDYNAMQEYQDRTGIQLIYPITEPDLRPKNEKNMNNANYWYETYKDPNSSNDVPVNYSFDENGKLVLPNIYRKFSTPVLNSADSKTRAIKATLEDKDGGYAIKMTAKAGSSYGGSTLKEDQAVGYLVIIHEEDKFFPEFVDTLQEASAFEFDTTNKAPKIKLTGHTNASDDGYYYFGIPADQGSAADLVKESTITAKSNIALQFYLDDSNEPVSSVEANKEYIFAANRVKDESKSYYVSTFINDDVVIKTSSSASITFSEVVGGYHVLVSKDKSKFYLGVQVNGNNHSLKRFAATEADDATIWTFDAATSSIKANVTGHTDASLDKEYSLGFTLGGGDEIKAGLFDASAFNDEILPLKVIPNDSLTPANVIDTAAKYRLYGGVSTYYDNYFYADGTFKGDNYFSKIRLEGENNFLYDYAIQKDGDTFEIRVCYYEYYHYYHTEIAKDRISRPIFIFGTTNTGQDIFTCLASGARFSFILAIVVASVNLIVGAIYGAIEGYYGGKIDMVMERIVEILSAVPFMIVITLLKYHMGKTPQVLLLFIAFFLTGWIGMSGLVRMQFYRFKNQEYVLAARTLGAKDPRIMFKHIFPNSLGTIVTSCVLVIPGMIFSETSLSYLGIINLNSGNMTSVGTLLAGAQPYISTYPHMILFPAIFISLLMLCFNLFGNGLRDAFNPSLRGTED